MRPTNRALLRRIIDILERAEDRRLVVQDHERLAGLPVLDVTTQHVIVTSRGELATLLLDLRDALTGVEA
jgi:hypothetical protein